MPLVLVLANTIIALCYYSIAALVGAQLWRSRSRNPLGIATAGIFLTCGLGHSVHVAVFLKSVLALTSQSTSADAASVLRWLCGIGSDAPGGLISHAGTAGILTSIQVAVDLLTIVPALGFLALRRRYGLLVDGEAVILDYERSLVGERARVADRTAALASAEARARELAEARAAAEQAAAALRMSETFLRTIITAAPVGIVTVGLDQTIQAVNPALAALLGSTPTALCGQPAISHIHPGDRTRVMDWIPILCRGERPAPIEIQVLHQDGRAIWVSLTATLLTDDAGGAIGALGIVQDMTARRAMEERLREAQRLESLGVLTGGIAHDFNNILTSVLGHAELAALDLPGHHPSRHDLEQIVVGAKHAADLVRQMLAYAGKGQITLAPVYLNALVREMINLLEVSVGKHARLMTRLDPQLPPVAADPSQLRQVVLNLLTNAAEAIGATDGVIMLITTVQHVAPAGLAGVVLGAEAPAGRYVGLLVSDTGGGIAPDIQQRMFDPFFTTKFTGRGLGLAAVQGIIRAHHGVLTVTSDPGTGATFAIWLPAGIEETVQSDSLNDVAPSGVGTLLVIDDEAPVRTVLATMLERYGYTVVTAESGAAGLSMLPTLTALHGVFIDMTMPGINGVAVAEQIATQQPALPLVLMSGYSTDELMAQRTRAGVVAVLAKPASLTAVRQVLLAIDQAWRLNSRNQTLPDGTSTGNHEL